MPKHIEPSTPGEILLEDFLRPLDLSQNKLAREIGVHPRRVNEIVLGRRTITADTALRLARYFGTGPEFWMNLQTDYDLRMARRGLGKSLLSKVKVRRSVAA